MCPTLMVLDPVCMFPTLMVLDPVCMCPTLVAVDPVYMCPTLMVLDPAFMCPNLVVVDPVCMCPTLMVFDPVCMCPTLVVVDPLHTLASHCLNVTVQMYSMSKYSVPSCNSTTFLDDFLNCFHSPYLTFPSHHVHYISPLFLLVKCTN
jgi:hypothetical protein